MEEKKSILKSVRLRPSAVQAVEDYQGEGFNDKLGNLIEDYTYKRDALVQDWNMLQAAIADKREELREIQRRVKAARAVDTRFAALVDALHLLLDG